jgi:hypothetical protein
MTTERYRLLIDEICTLSLIPNSPDFHENPNFMVHNVDFSLQHRAMGESEQVAIYADMGPLSSGNHDIVLLSLLEINFHLFHSGQSAVFSYNTETQRILLMGSVEMAKATAPTLLLMMKAFAKLASEWRRSAFQEKEPKMSSTLANQSHRGKTRSGDLSQRLRSFE